MVNMFLNGSD